MEQVGGNRRRAGVPVGSSLDGRLLPGGRHTPRSCRWRLAPDWPKPSTKRTQGRIGNDPSSLYAPWNIPSPT